MIRKLINMILHARVTKVSDDAELYPSVQIAYLGKVADATRVLPYPLVGNPRLDSLGLKLNVGADEGNRVVILHDPKNRVKGLLEGEGGIANSITGDFILLKEDGIEIFTNGNSNVTVSGDSDITVSGFANVNVNLSSNITVNGDVNLVALKTSIKGNVNIDGNLNITGTSTASDHISGGISGNSHVHGGVTTGGSTTLVPQNV